MTHLIVSREYPPPAYPQGGIGTYAAHIARLLAEAGETVHVIGERWSGAPAVRQESIDGRLIVHRVALDKPLPGTNPAEEQHILDAFRHSDQPAAQAFSWQVARLAEFLVSQGNIDCIEGQEFEAPLYYFLLRRGLGLGPKQQPPCLVHLHSPTQVICHHNDWDIGRRDHLNTKRLEDYVIQASDAALCPSRYLAREAERHYGFPGGWIQHIPLPHGDTTEIARSADTWANGSICYFGRMEPRKGIFEWVDAAVRVSRERPGLRFELIGSDTSLANAWPASVRNDLRARIPPDLREHISLLDAVPRAQLRDRLAVARFSVVPSRWENYPNTCVEAMSSGLPVLVSPHGGMVEMVEDGRTGWVAEGATPDALASALRRALDVPADALARMGREAAATIRQLCDNGAITERHIALRRRIAGNGAARSCQVPSRGSSCVLFGPTTSSTTGLVRHETDRTSLDGVAVVVELSTSDDVDNAVAALTSQTRAVSWVFFDYSELSTADRTTAARKASDAGLPVVGDESIRGVVDALPFLDGTVTAVAILSAGCTIRPEFIAESLAMLSVHQGVGTVSHWHADGGGAVAAIRPMPMRPYQWIIDDVGPCAVFNRSALEDVGWIDALHGGRLSAGDLTLALQLAGWSSIGVPSLLSHRHRPMSLQRRALERAGGVWLRQVLQTRFPGEWAADASELLALTPGLNAPAATERSLSALLRLPWEDRLRLAGDALKQPGKVVAWLAARRRGARTTGR